jgi:hypothetical protein|nr:MAG TPA: hypothetical protein [Bacteriophage sp.]
MNDFNIISVRVRKMPPFTQEERKRIFSQWKTILKSHGLESQKDQSQTQV